MRPHVGWAVRTGRSTLFSKNSNFQLSLLISWIRLYFNFVSQKIQNFLKSVIFREKLESPLMRLFINHFWKYSWILFPFQDWIFVKLYLFTDDSSDRSYLGAHTVGYEVFDLLQFIRNLKIWNLEWIADFDLITHRDRSLNSELNGI